MWPCIAPVTSRMLLALPIRPQGSSVGWSRDQSVQTWASVPLDKGVRG